MNTTRNIAKRGMQLTGFLLTAVTLAACGQTMATDAVNAAFRSADASSATPSANGGAVAPAAMIAAHNQWRAKTGVPDLAWSDKLAVIAQKWADHLANTSCSHGHSGNCYGENLYIASARTWSDGRGEMQKKTAQDVVDAWGSEIQYYDYSDNSCHSVCGHYTQVVWKDSKEVGCGIAVCGDKSQIWVCNYDPPGDMVGKKPY